MMSDVVLQVLLILAYLAIGLIAITFPIYAICVTFLPQERWESEKERERRIEKLQTKISELAARLRTEQSASEQIKEEMAKCEAELKGTKLRVHCLTARGAVGLPISYLALSLLMVGVGLYYFNLEYLVGVIVSGFFSFFLSAMAVHRLYKAITAVEYAALRPARSIDFRVGFGRAEESTKRVKLNKKTDLMIGVITFEDNIKDCVISTNIPSEIEVSPITTYPQLNVARYSEYTFVSRYIAFLPKGQGFGFSSISIPKKIGNYVFPVVVSGSGIHEVKKELILEVVE